MSNQWDEFSKSLSEETLPRRESLRRLGAVFAGAVLGSLGLKNAVGAPKSDPCKAFCKCRNKSQQSQCIAACRDCDSDPRFLCGSCGGYACTNLGSDPWNCGACFNECGEAGPYEYATCIDGSCKYDCVSGAVRCNGTCTLLDSDHFNCGACGNICPEPGPNEYSWCENGQCQSICYDGADYCGGVCTFLDYDVDNCGECGHVCGGSTPYCTNGICTECASGTTLCGDSCVYLYYDNDNCGACGNVCGGSTPYCYQGVCTDCADGAICNGLCTDITWDSTNCGACGNVCPDGTACSFGRCQGVCPDCGW